MEMLSSLRCDKHDFCWSISIGLVVRMSVSGYRG